PEHRGIVRNPSQPQQRDRTEPHDHDRPEDPPYSRRTVTLEDEQHDENDDRDDPDHVIQRRGSNLQSFHRAQHGDGWGDHSIAIQQGGSEQSERNKYPPAVAFLPRPDQRQKRENPALAAGVGLHDAHDVLEGDDEIEGPEDERENAEDVVVGEGNAMGPGETLLERVQRTGADVAVDDPKSGERERGKRPSPGRRAAWRGAV